MERVAEVQIAMDVLRGLAPVRDTLRAAYKVAVDIQAHPKDPAIKLEDRYSAMAEGLSRIDHSPRYYEFMEGIVDNIVRVVVTDARHHHLSVAQGLIYWKELNRSERSKVAKQMMETIQAGFHAETGVITPAIPVKISWTKTDPDSSWSPVSQNFTNPSNLLMIDEANHPRYPKGFATGIHINPNPQVGYEDPFEVFRSLFKAYYHEFLKHVAKEIKLAQRLVQKGMEEDLNLIRDIVQDRIHIDMAAQGKEPIFVEDRLPSNSSFLLHDRVFDALKDAIKNDEVMPLERRFFFGLRKPEPEIA